MQWVYNVLLVTPIKWIISYQIKSKSKIVKHGYPYGAHGIYKMHECWQSSWCYKVTQILISHLLATIQYHTSSKNPHQMILSLLVEKHVVVLIEEETSDIIESLLFTRCTPWQRKLQNNTIRLYSLYCWICHSREIMNGFHVAMAYNM